MPSFDLYHEAPEPRTIVPKRFTDSFERGTGARITAFREGLARWVNAHKDPKDRRVANELAKSIHYVPFREFLSKFKDALESLSGEMRGPYYLVTHVVRHGENRSHRGPGTDIDLPKSSAWLAPYVKEALGARHAVQGHVWVNSSRRELSVSDSARNDSAGGKQLRADRWVPSGDRNVIYTDDGSYSGEQIINFYLMFCAKMWNDYKSMSRTSGRTGGGTGGGTGGVTHLWFVIPYMTDRAVYKLRAMSMHHMALESILEHPEDVEEYGATIKNGEQAREFLEFIRSHLQVHFNEQAYERMPLTTDVFSRLRIKADYLKSEGVIGAGLFLFEHKAPDAVSFPRPLALGQLLVKRAFKASSDAPGQVRVPFMSQVDEKPYGYTQPGMMSHLIGSRNDAAVRYNDRPVRPDRSGKPGPSVVSGGLDHAAAKKQASKLVKQFIKSLGTKKK